MLSFAGYIAHWHSLYGLPDRISTSPKSVAFGAEGDRYAVARLIPRWLDRELTLAYPRGLTGQDNSAARATPLLVGPADTIGELF